jgi:hypothetical protein
MDSLAESLRPRQQPREPLLRLVVPHRDPQRLPLADDHHQLLAPRDARVNEISLEQRILLRRQRNDDSRKLGARDLWIVMA